MDIATLILAASLGSPGIHQDQLNTRNARVLSCDTDMRASLDSLFGARMLQILFCTMCGMNCEQFVGLLGVNNLEQLAEADKNEFIKVRGIPIVLEFEPEGKLVALHLSPMFRASRTRLSTYNKLHGLWEAREITVTKNGFAAIDDGLPVTFEDDVMTFFTNTEFTLPTLFTIDENGPFCVISLVRTRKIGNGFIPQQWAVIPNSYKFINIFGTVYFGWACGNQKIPSVWILSRR